MTTAKLEPAKSKNKIGVILASSFVGSTIEFYDFLLFAAAATLVFPTVFFSEMSPTVGLFASYGLFAAGYISRPLGGIIFGHLGDRIGRKKVLVITIVGMGIVSTLIGLVPSGQTIGSLGAILVVFFRIMQGIFLGGEWGGAALLALEHAKSEHRAFAASFANAGGPAGATLSALVMGIFSSLPDEQFLTWGWRVPFLFSFVLMLVGLFIRFRVSETPIFREIMDKYESEPTAKRSVPLLTVLKSPVPVLIAVFATISAFVFTSVHATIGVATVVEGGIDRSSALLIFSLTQLSGVIFIIASAALTDRRGRRPVMVIFLILHAIALPFIFWAWGSGATGLVIIGYLLSIIFHSGYYGPSAAFISERFPAAIRYTGASVSYAIAGIIGGLTPSMIISIQLATEGMTWPIVALAGVLVVSIIATLASKETRSLDITK